MLEENLAYIEYLERFSEITKPQMPTFNLAAYTDSEYMSAINVVMQDYENVFDFDITLKHLKED